MDGFTKNPKMQCFREGGQVKYETRKEHKEEVAADINQDKKIVKKAFKMHDSQEHKGEHTDLSKLKKGGRAKKATGTVKQFDKASGQYGAKKTAADNKNIKEAKQFNPVKLKEGGTVQPGATVSQQKYYDQNKAAAKKKEAAADYEAFGSRGDAARKGMEEGRMSALGDAYKKGGKVKKYADGGLTNRLEETQAESRRMQREGIPEEPTREQMPAATMTRIANKFSNKSSATAEVNKKRSDRGADAEELQKLLGSDVKVGYKRGGKVKRGGKC